MRGGRYAALIRFILNEKVLSLFSILALTLGSVGLSGIRQIRNTLENRLASQSRELLGADISLSGRRSLNADELKNIASILPLHTQTTTLTEFYSMAVTRHLTRLAEVNAIEAAYPFYGDLRSQESSENTLQSALPRIWVSSEFQSTFDVHLNETVRLGKIDFKITRILPSENSGLTRMMSLAPRAYIERSWAIQTGLLRFGSTRTERVLLKIPAEIDLKKLRSRLQQMILDPGIRIVTHSESSQQLARALTLITPYLGLISIFGWILAWITVYYLGQMLVQRALPLLLTVRALGQVPADLLLAFATMAFGWALAAGALTSLSIFFLMPWIARRMPNFEPLLVGHLPFHFLNWIAPTLLLFLSLTEPLLRVLRARPAQVFDDVHTLPKLPRWQALTLRLTSLALLLGMLVFESRSYSLAALGLSVITLAWVVFPRIFMRILEPLAQRLSFNRLKITLRRILHYRRESELWISVLGLSSILTLTLLSLEHWMQHELLNPARVSLPHSFLFDIQDEQLIPFREWARVHHWDLGNESPLIQARLLGLNDRPVDRIDEDPKFITQEEDQSQRLKNRTFNLSIRSGLSRSESSVNTASAKHSDAIPCSVEVRFAQRLQLQLNDTLQFDVQGATVLLEVTELRKVRWTAFEPNFFIWVRPGTSLDGAPKTWLATLRPKPEALDTMTAALQIQHDFPNISLVDVQSLVRKMTQLFSELSQAIRLITGLVVLMASFSLFAMLWERIARERISSEDGPFFMRSFRLLTLSAIGVSSVLSIALNQLLSRLFFEGDWIFPPRSQWAVILFFLLLSEILIRLSLIRRKNR